MKVIVITSIATDKHPVLNEIANECLIRNIPFLVIGDRKSPSLFNLKGCEFYSLERQRSLSFQLAQITPERHYSRKNLGYLIAMQQGASEIQETDDDNIPFSEFWETSSSSVNGLAIQNRGWFNVYSHFSNKNIWPRGFPLEFLKMNSSIEGITSQYDCPIHQGLANENPDVDAVFRLVASLPIDFENRSPLVLLKNTWCPFNSQNTRWYRKAFPLLYLPSYCSFRMTDIWRSFVAQRISWECNWGIYFHNATVRQERNEHNLLKDFEDEIPGYLNNAKIARALEGLTLHAGEDFIYDNLLICYKQLVELGVVDHKELLLVDTWIRDCKDVLK